jgi:hypothetical protein
MKTAVPFAFLQEQVQLHLEMTGLVLARLHAEDVCFGDEPVPLAVSFMQDIERWSASFRE